MFSFILSDLRNIENWIRSPFAWMAVLFQIWMLDAIRREEWTWAVFILIRAELREVLADDAHAPAFQRKRDRVWVRRAKRLLRQVR